MTDSSVVLSESRIYCRSGASLPRRAIIEFITEGWSSEQALTFEPPASSSTSVEPEWSTLTWTYAEGKPPVAFARHVRDTVLEEAVNGILWILDASRVSKGRDRLRAHVGETVQLFTIQWNPGAVTDDCREMLPAIAAFIGRTLDGVVELPQEGRSNAFFDSNFNRFYRL